MFGARDLFDDSEIEPQTASAPQVEDCGLHVGFPRPGQWVTSSSMWSTASRMYQGLKEIQQAELPGYMVLEFAEAAQALCAAHGAWT